MYSRTICAALVAAMVVLGACVPVRSAQQDPGAAGPFAIGFTARTFTRTLADGTQRKLTTAIWYPARPPADAPSKPFLGPVPNVAPSDDARHPLVIFSHGYTANPNVYSLLLNHLASQGFVVAAPEHNDCGTSFCPPGPPWSSEPTTPEQGARRIEDIQAVLDNVLSLSAGTDDILKGLIDPEQVGLAGQSFGGWTTLQGMHADPRFRAGLLLNPATLIKPAPDPSQVSRPIMLMAGELDPMVPVTTSKEFFGQTATTTDRFFVVVPKAGHQFADRCFEQAAILPCSATLPQDRLNHIVASLGTAFLLRYVANRSEYNSLLDSGTQSEYTLIHAGPGSSGGALPTAQPVAYPTSIVPAPTPVGPPGTVIGLEDLLPTSLGGPGRYQRGYVGGEYVVRSPASVTSGSAFPNQSESLLAGRYASASLAVDVRLIDPTMDQWVNIACRSQNETTQYRLTILPARGIFQVVRWINGTGSLLVEPRSSAAIHTGEQTNRLELNCHGDTLDASINDVPVASITDATFREGQMWIGLGHMGPGSPVFTSPLVAPVEGHFSNLVVTQR